MYAYKRGWFCSVISYKKTNKTYNSPFHRDISYGGKSTIIYKSSIFA